jgi:hypothetical protein
MADQNSNGKTWLRKVLDGITFASLIVMVTMIMTFGKAWGQIREEVSQNKESIKNNAAVVSKLCIQSGKIETDLAWIKTAIIRIEQKIE